MNASVANDAVAPDANRMNQMVEIKVPELGESIQEVQISQWLKKEGEWVEKDDDLVELESEKAAQSLPAPVSGILKKIALPPGEFAPIGTVIGELDESASPESASSGSSNSAAEPAVEAAAPETSSGQTTATVVMPAAERMLEEYKISADKVVPTGPGGRLLKEDVLAYVEKHNLRPGKGESAEPAARPATPVPAPPPAPATPIPAPTPVAVVSEAMVGTRDEEVKPMSMIRRTIATRLVEAQQAAALLPTFNEIDMKPVMDLRNKYKNKFLEIHGVKLGFMSSFAKACVEALKRYPAVNSEIRGNNIVTRHYCDIGVAIGGGKGLVVPVLRNCENLSFAAIERQISQYADLAMQNKIKPQDLEGGTFTISNGGIYGSLLSTPIVNPPQSGILGMHTIQERPIAMNGDVVIRPMMYIALTYDHRIVDGREAVGFLKSIKEVLEEPDRLFLEV